MRGGRKQAKPDCGRPLDGRVRALVGNAHGLTRLEHLLNTRHVRSDLLCENTWAYPKQGKRRPQMPDCPAQHGGAKRQQPSDLAALPQRAEARRIGDHNRLSGERDRVWVQGGERRTKAARSCAFADGLQERSEM